MRPPDSCGADTPVRVFLLIRRMCFREGHDKKLASSWVEQRFQARSVPALFFNNLWSHDSSEIFSLATSGYFWLPLSAGMYFRAFPVLAFRGNLGMKRVLKPLEHEGTQKKSGIPGTGEMKANQDWFFKVELYTVKIGAAIVFVVFVCVEVIHALRYLVGW